MPIRVQCGACGREYQLKDKFAGLTVKCPNCGGEMHAPAAAVPPPTPAAAPGVSDDLFGMSFESPDFSAGAGSAAAPPVAASSYSSSPPQMPAPAYGDPGGGYGAPAMGMPGFGMPGYGMAQAQPMYNFGSEYANFAFNRDKFLLRQKVMSISSKYYVWDEQGRSILFVERPAHLLRNLTALLAGLVAGFCAFIFFVALFGTIAAATQTDWIMIPGFLLGVPSGIVAYFAIFTLLCKKRHVTIYQDDTKQVALFQIFQDKKFWIINATYTVADMQGQMIARFHKNYLYNLYRKRWDVHNAQGEVLCLAKEDSIINGLIRRFITKLLVTNFIIVAPENDDILLGEFNRKYTLLDRYVLDMTADWQRQLDRRVALALGIMLDTGESR